MDNDDRQAEFNRRRGLRDLTYYDPATLREKQPWQHYGKSCCIVPMRSWSLANGREVEFHILGSTNRKLRLRNMIRLQERLFRDKQDGVPISHRLLAPFAVAPNTDHPLSLQAEFGTSRDQMYWFPDFKKRIEARQTPGAEGDGSTLLTIDDLYNYLLPASLGHFARGSRALVKDAGVNTAPLQCATCKSSGGLKQCVQVFAQFDPKDEMATGLEPYSLLMFFGACTQCVRADGGSHCSLVDGEFDLAFQLLSGIVRQGC